MINGFGLERLGLFSLRNPVIVTIFTLLITLSALWGMTRLQFSGENIQILRDGSQELKDYDELLTNFRDFNNDAVILMRLENLASVEGIETFRELNFEFQLDERVESVLSIFSLVRYDREQGWQSALSSEFESDEQVKAELEQLVKDVPSAQSLFSKDFDSAVMVVYTKKSAISDVNVLDTMRGLNDLAKEFETDTISLSIAGQPAIRSDLIRSIASDVIYLAPIAILLCAFLAFILFRQFIAMVLCAAPCLLSIFWFLGGAGLTGNSLNFLTNVLPVLLIVIIFANTLHLYLKWQNITLEGKHAPLEALEVAIREIGPACSISSLTTAAALISLCFTSNHGLFELGVIGAIAVMGGYVCLMMVLPIGIYWALKAGFFPRGGKTGSLGALAKPALRLLKYPGLSVTAGLVLCVIGLFAHFNIDSRFRLIDYLGSQSEVGQSEGYIDQTYSGTTPLFAIVDMDPNLPLADPANEKRAYDTLSAIQDVFPAGSFYSLADFADEIKQSGGELNEALVDELPRYLTSRFISNDKKQLLVTIFASSNLSASQLQEKLNKLDTALNERNITDHVRITGYPVLAGIVAPRLMDNLRISLLLAVILSISIVAFSARSLQYGLACLIPNMIPIVAVELILYLLNIPLNLSITVALTVAFGIAVDDSVHLLNQYLKNKETDDHQIAISEALKEVTPAFFSTTLILSGGLLIMSFSSLPAMAVFSIVVIMTLLFAFLADIFQLPAYLLIVDKWWGQTKT